MAKLERELNYDFDELLHRIEQGIMNGSSTASLEIRLPQSHWL